MVDKMIEGLKRVEASKPRDFPRVEGGVIGIVPEQARARESAATVPLEVVPPRPRRRPTWRGTKTCNVGKKLCDEVDELLASENASQCPRVQLLEALLVDWLRSNSGGASFGHERLVVLLKRRAEYFEDDEEGDDA